MAHIPFRTAAAVQVAAGPAPRGDEAPAIQQANGVRQGNRKEGMENLIFGFLISYFADISLFECH